MQKLTTLEGIKLLFDVMANEDLWPLLVVVQDVMWTAQLVSFLPIQEGHAHHSRWETSGNSILQLCDDVIIFEIGSIWYIKDEYIKIQISVTPLG